MAANEISQNVLLLLVPAGALDDFGNFVPLGPAPAARSALISSFLCVVGHKKIVSRIRVSCLNLVCCGFNLRGQELMICCRSHSEAVGIIGCE